MTVDILEEVKLIISKGLKVPIEQLMPDTRMGDLGAESLDVIEIVFNLEEKFGIDIPLQANEALRPVGSTVDNVDSEYLEQMTIAGIAQLVKEQVEAKA
jgi:acyl carrier protein